MWEKVPQFCWSWLRLRKLTRRLWYQIINMKPLRYQRVQLNVVLIYKICEILCFHHQCYWLKKKIQEKYVWSHSKFLTLNSIGENRAMRTDFSHSSVIFLSIEIYWLVKIFKLKIRKPNENIFMIMIISMICITNNGFSFFNLIVWL